MTAAAPATARKRAGDPVISSSTVHTVHFQGNTSFHASTLRAVVSLKPGGLFDGNQLQFSQSALESFYRDQGHADVRVSTETAFSPGLGQDILFRIREGPLYHLRAIEVTGNHAISTPVIRRQMNLQPGEPFSQVRLYDAMRELYTAGYFHTVDITTAPTSSPDQVDIRVNVKERPTRYLKGGFGYGAATKERVSMGYEDRNFFGNARRLNLIGVFSGFLTNPDKYQTIRGEINLDQPNLFGSPYEGQTLISREIDKRDAYGSANATWLSTLGRHYGKHLTANLQYRYQGTHITRINPQEALTTPAFTNISAFGPNFTYDNTNDPFLPSYGWRVLSAIEKGLNWGIGDLRFFKVTARTGRYDTFFHRVTLFEGLQYGLERPDNPVNSMPIFERFFIGGANTVRGYEERELGPKDNEGAPSGGEEFAVFNLEARTRLYKKLFGVIFLDGGQLWQRTPGQDWPTILLQRWGDLAYGTGTGLRFNTPIGAVRLEAGYKLNPPNPSSSFLYRTAVYFTLGEVF